MPAIGGVRVHVVWRMCFVYKKKRKEKGAREGGKERGRAGGVGQLTVHVMMDKQTLQTLSDACKPYRHSCRHTLDDCSRPPVPFPRPPSWQQLEVCVDARVCVRACACMCVCVRLCVCPAEAGQGSDHG